MTPDNKCIFYNEEGTVEHLKFLCPRNFKMENKWKYLFMSLKLKCQLDYIVASNGNVTNGWTLSVIQFLYFNFAFTK